MVILYEFITTAQSTDKITLFDIWDVLGLLITTTVFALLYHSRKSKCYLLDCKKFLIIAYVIVLFMFLYNIYEEYTYKKVIVKSLIEESYIRVRGEISSLNIKTRLDEEESSQVFISFSVNGSIFSLYVENSMDKYFFSLKDRNWNKPIKYDGQHVDIDYVKILGENKIIKMTVYE
jgi:hypothetical protein